MSQQALCLCFARVKQRVLILGDWLHVYDIERDGRISTLPAAVSEMLQDPCTTTVTFHVGQMQSVNTFKYVFLSLQNRCTLHLDPLEFQVAIKWWLGLPTSQGQVCHQCSSHSLDYFGHHALTCRKGPGVVTRHNTIRDTVFELCQRACLEAQLVAGSSLGHEERQT